MQTTSEHEVSRVVTALYRPVAGCMVSFGADVVQSCLLEMTGSNGRKTAGSYTVVLLIITVLLMQQVISRCQVMFSQGECHNSSALIIKAERKAKAVYDKPLAQQKRLLALGLCLATGVYHHLAAPLRLCLGDQPVHQRLAIAMATMVQVCCKVVDLQLLAAEQGEDQVCCGTHHNLVHAADVGHMEAVSPHLFNSSLVSFGIECIALCQDTVTFLQRLWAAGNAHLTMYLLIHGDTKPVGEAVRGGNSILLQ